MSLPYTPQFSPDPHGVGGLYGGGSGASLGAGATVTVPLAIGAGTATTSGYPASCLSARLAVRLIPGATVAATAGLQVQVYSSSDGGTNYDSTAYATGPALPAVASTVASASIDLPPGQYKLALTNLDATNAVSVSASLGTVG
jgi:hypothetical protein